VERIPQASGGADMKLTVFAVVSTLPLLPHPAQADDQRPMWITDEKLAALLEIGIDPATDLEMKGYYHWRYRAKNKLSIDSYSCPIGSTVDISRNIVIIIPPKETPCVGLKGGDFGALKLLPSGLAEPNS
jgi:hypothetical protein